MIVRSCRFSGQAQKAFYSISEVERWFVTIVACIWNGLIVQIVIVVLGVVIAMMLTVAEIMMTMTANRRK